jgi:hypothetical protein
MAADHDGARTVGMKALRDDPEALLSQGDPFFYRSYVGPKGWIGVDLRSKTVDWTEVGDRAQELPAGRTEEAVSQPRLAPSDCRRAGDLGGTLRSRDRALWTRVRYMAARLGTISPWQPARSDHFAKTLETL